MLDGGSDDMALLRIGLERGMNRGVVALDGARRENYFARICTDQIRDLRRAVSITVFSFDPNL